MDESMFWIIIVLLILLSGFVFVAVLYLFFQIDNLKRENRELRKFVQSLILFRNKVNVIIKENGFEKREEKVTSVSEKTIKEKVHEDETKSEVIKIEKAEKTVDLEGKIEKTAEENVISDIKKAQKEVDSEISELKVKENASKEAQISEPEEKLKSTEAVELNKNISSDVMKEENPSIKDRDEMFKETEDNARIKADSTYFEPTIKDTWGKIPKTDLSKVLNIEFWLNKAGIVLFLIGIVFLFKYSNDKGWITPLIRIIMAFIAGIVMNILGIKIGKERLKFGQVLTGGGIATLYITIFASFQMYKLINFETAFFMMILLSLYSFGCALKQNAVTFAMIGFLGGILTPFALYNGSGDIGTLLIYVLLLSSVSLGVYFYKGWITLLWASFLGSYLTFFTILVVNASNLEKTGKTMAIGIVVFWCLYFSVNLLRELLWSSNPEKWPKYGIGFLKDWISGDIMKFLKQLNHIYFFSVPMVSLVYLVAVMPDNKMAAGIIALVMSILYVVISIFIVKSKKNIDRIEYTLGTVAILLFTFSLTVFFRGNILITAIALEACFLVILAKRLSDNIYHKIAHILYLFLGIISFLRIFNLNSLEILGFTRFENRINFINNNTFTDLIIVISGCVGSIYTNKAFAKKSFRVYFGFVLLLAIFWREIWEIPNGHQYLIVIWTLQSLITYFVARKIQDNALLNSLNIFSVVLILMVFNRIVYSNEITPMLNMNTVINLAIIAAGIYISIIIKNLNGKYYYRFVSLILLAMIFYFDFKEAEYGIYITTALILLEGIIIYTIASIFKKTNDKALDKGFAEIMFFMTYLGIIGLLITISRNSINNLGVDRIILGIDSIIAISFLSIVSTREKEYREKMVRGILAILLTTIAGAVFAAEYNLVAICFIVESWIIYMLFMKSNDKYLENSSFFILGIAGIMSMIKLFANNDEQILINQQTAIDLVTFATGIFYFVNSKSSLRNLVNIGAVVILSNMFIREFNLKMENGIYITGAFWMILSYIYVMKERVKIKFYSNMGFLLNIFGFIFMELRIFNFAESEMPIINLNTMVEFAGMILMFLLFKRLKLSKNTMNTTLMLLHIMFMYIIYRDFSNTQGVITAIWGVYSIVILIASIRKNNALFIKVALLSLTVTILKMFFIDLSAVSSIWRILLFIGSGMVLLAISYYIQTLWKPNKSSEQEDKKE